MVGARGSPGFGLLLGSRRRGELFFFWWSDDRGEGIVDSETLVVEIVQYVCALWSTNVLSRPFECGFCVVEKVPKGGDPGVLVGVEFLLLRGGRETVEMGLCDLDERCARLVCNDDVLLQM